MENNKFDQFYKDSLSGYEAGVSGSFWLRLKWRLMWLNTKTLLFGMGALLLIGTGVFTGYYFSGLDFSYPNEMPLYQNRSPESMAALFVMNDTESYTVEHFPITVEPLLSEADISQPIALPVSENSNIGIRTKTQIPSSSVESYYLLSVPSANTGTSNENTKENIEIEQLSGLGISDITYLDQNIDTVLSPYFIKQKKNWVSLTLYAAPTYTIPEVSSNTMDDEYMSYRKEHETATLSWSAGFDVQVNFKKWYIQSGLNFSSYSNQRNYNQSFLAFDSLRSYYVYDTTWGLVFDPPILGKPVVIGIDSSLMPAYNDMNEGVNTWKYFEIPLVVGYKFNLHRFGIDIGTGFSYGYLVAVSGNVPSLTEKNVFTDLSEEDRINKHQFNYLLQLGVSYYITPKWSVVAQPYFKQNIRSVFDASYPVEERYRSFGIKIGLKINL